MFQYVVVIEEEEIYLNGKALDIYHINKDNFIQEVHLLQDSQTKEENGEKKIGI